MSWYPDLAEYILKGLYAQIRPALTLFVEAAGYLPDCDLILMQTAYWLEPSRLHLGHLIDSMPYTNPEIFLDCMNAAVSHGWLYQEGDHYGLTESGREIVEGLNELCDRLYAKIAVLSDLELTRLRYFSDQVIEKINQLPEPVQKPAFNLKLCFGRYLEMPLIVQFRRQTFILLAFREDVHVAAWRPYESDGKLWETFSLIGRGQAGSAAEIVAQLPHRNYSAFDYAVALDELEVRGWIAVQAKRFIPTELAIRILNRVDQRTHQIFDAAFSGLNNAEKEEYQRLMQKFSAKLSQVKTFQGKNTTCTRIEAANA